MASVRSHLPRRRQVRRFSFFKRKGVIYAQLKNPKTGLYGTARSTGATEEDDATLVVAAGYVMASRKGRPAESHAPRTRFSTLRPFSGASAMTHLALRTPAR
jgi:hypothetical protein